jgi:predicted transcriptional regulator of viral defense system
MQAKNIILSKSDLSLLEDALLQFGRLVTFEQLASLFAETETRDSMSRKIALLVKKGWLLRLKKALYLVLTDITTLGTNDLSEYVIAQALHKDSYVSFENALQYHGLFDQMLSTVGSVTTTYARRHAVQQTTYVFSQVRQELYFGFAEEVIGSYRVSIAEKEKALLDLLYFKTSAYTVSIVLEKLREYTHRFESEKLQQYTQRYGIGMVRTVGFLLDQVHVDTIQLHDYARKQRNSYSKLTRQSSQFDAKWRLYYDPYLID